MWRDLMSAKKAQAPKKQTKNGHATLLNSTLGMACVKGVGILHFFMYKALQTGNDHWTLVI